MSFFEKIFNKKETTHYLGFRIIPLGAYCLPRVIATFGNFKPTKKLGEKTLPFDLAFFWNFDAILWCLETEFKYFFEDIRFGLLNNQAVLKDLKILFHFDGTKNHWVSDRLSTIFNHEWRMKSKAEFVERYERRIKNFYEYIKDERYEVYFLIASFSVIRAEQIKRLEKIIEKYRSKNSFNIIIINQSSTKYSLKDKQVSIIDETDDTFIKVQENDNWNWVGALKRKEVFPYADKFYNEIVDKLKKIILKI